MINPDNIDDYLIDRVTEAGNTFFAVHGQIESFRWYIAAADYVMANHMGELKDTFSAIFRKPGVEQIDQIADMIADQGEVLFTSSTYQLSLGQMAFCRIVDNFVTYLKDLLGEVVHAQPRVLSSDEKESLKFILDFESLNELYSAIAEKKVERLFFGGMKDIRDFFEDRLNVDPFEDSNALEEAIRLTKYRNLIVHNRGRVNEQFLRAYPESDYELGDLLSFNFQDISRHNLFFQIAVIRLDPMVAEKYGLPTYNKREFAEKLDSQ